MNSATSHIRTAITAAVIIMTAFVASSCKKKVEMPVISDWETNRDVVTGMEVQYPKEWLINADPKSTKIYSSQTVASKFYEVYTAGTTVIGENEGGVEFEIRTETMKDAQAGSLADYKKQFLETYDALRLGNEHPAVIGKDTGVAYSFKVKVGKDTDLEGEKVVVEHDSAFYVVSVAGFNEYYQVYKPLLDKIVASIKLPRPKIKSSDPNAVLMPSPDMTTYSNNLFEFQHPDNFEVSILDKKGAVLFAMHMEVLNGRKDCTIDIDVIPTKTDKGEVKFDKFVEENKPKYRPTSTSKETIDGLSAVTLMSVPAKNVDRKVYFFTKGEKIYQIILTWYKPMASNFKPAFDKIMASMKIK